MNQLDTTIERSIITGRSSQQQNFQIIVGCVDAPRASGDDDHLTLETVLHHIRNCDRCTGMKEQAITPSRLKNAAA